MAIFWRRSGFKAVLRYYGLTVGGFEDSPFEGIAVKIRKFLQQGMGRKVSPPFEGGVAGTIDYLIITRFISRPGWLIN